MKMRSPSLWGILIVVLAGCNARNANTDPNAANSTAGTATTDATVNSDVKAKLAANDTGGMASVNASTQDKVVTLTGPVDTQSSKDKAVMMARQVNGVSSVQDQMTIGGPGCCGHKGPGMMQEGRGMGEGMKPEPQ